MTRVHRTEYQEQGEENGESSEDLQRVPLNCGTEDRQAPPFEEAQEKEPPKRMRGHGDSTHTGLGREPVPTSQTGKPMVHQHLRKAHRGSCLDHGR